MSRYYFHNEDGQCFPDKDGIDLPDMAAVRHTAMRVLTEMMCAHEAHVYEEGAWRLTVTDAEGLTLFLIDVGVTNAASTATGAPARRA